MGFFDFVKDAGKKLLGKGDDNAAIQKEIETSFEEVPVQGLVVEVDGHKVTLAGVASCNDTREKCVLIAGNVEGVEQVNADQLVSVEQISEENSRDLPEPTFYTIKKGDSLWKIASHFYKDGSKYPIIVEANIEVIKDPDLIYPGQAIRIPDIA